LIVDDHPVVRTGYRSLLESAGDVQVVAEAGGGEEGCARYKEHAQCTVLLNLGMPGIGGLETIRRLIAWDPEARVLAFTIHDGAVMASRALQAGALGYLSKYSGPAQVIEAVRAVAAGVRYVEPDLAPEVVRQQSGGAHPEQMLTLREFQVFQLLANGSTVSEIAQLLAISPKTAGVHHTNIMRKLQAKNAVHLARLAIQWGVAAA
jgi:two-component system invasion response regulator UvrY